MQTSTGGMQAQPPDHAIPANFPSTILPPDLYLEPLPDPLKYANLGNTKELPIIISAELTDQEGEKLMMILKIDKGAIRWTSSDEKGTPYTLCTHNIHIDLGPEPIWQPQRRLDPPIGGLTIRGPLSSRWHLKRPELQRQ